jgi:hypothetical protein
MEFSPWVTLISATGNCIEGCEKGGFFWNDNYADWADDLARYFLS